MLNGLSPVDDFLELVLALGDERDPNVWQAVTEAFRLLYVVTPEADRPDLQNFIRRVMSPVFDRLGWTPAPNEALPVGVTRARLLKVLGTIGGDQSVRDRAAGLHSKYLDDRSAVDGNLADPLAVIVAWQGRAADWETFVDRWKHSADPQEEIRFLYTLGQFENPELIQRTLDMLLTDVRNQNAPFLALYLLDNLAGGEIAWEWVKANWDAIQVRFPSKSLHRTLEGVKRLCRPEVAADVAAFLRARPIPGEERTIEQSVEMLEVNVAFREREAPRIGDLLRALR